MKKLLISFLLSLLLVLSIVYGALNYVTPTAYSTSVTTKVNVSLWFNQTINSEVTYNLTIYNRSSSSGAYGYLNSTTIQNGTKYANYVVLKDDERSWLYLNVTNNTGGPTISSVRIIDVDTRYNVMEVEVQLNMDSLRLGNVSNLFNDEVCGGLTFGTIIYNHSTPGYFFGCTPDGWINLTSVN